MLHPPRSYREKSLVAATREPLDVVGERPDFPQDVARVLPTVTLTVRGHGSVKRAVTVPPSLYLAPHAELVIVAVRRQHRNSVVHAE